MFRRVGERHFALSKVARHKSNRAKVKSVEKTNAFADSCSSHFFIVGSTFNYGKRLKPSLSFVSRYNYGV